MNRILFFYPGALGDLLLAAPVFSALKKFRNSTSIHLVGGLSQVELLRQLHLVDAGSSFDDSFFLPLFSTTPLPDSLMTWLEKFDRIVFWQRGSVHPQLREHPRSFLANPRPDPHPALHHAQFLYDSVRVFLHLPEQDVQNLTLRFPRSLDIPPFLLIHPGSGSPTKNWPLENFLELAARWQHRTGGQVGFLLGPAEEAQALQFQNTSKTRGYAVFQSPPWPQLLELFRQTTHYLGNDSGISHLAGLLGLRGLVFFRTTDPKIWRPLGKKLLAVRVK